MKSGDQVGIGIGNESLVISCLTILPVLLIRNPIIARNTFLNYMVQ
jgi:hypothetical protein